MHDPDDPSGSAWGAIHAHDRLAMGNGRVRLAHWHHRYERHFPIELARSQRALDVRRC